MAYIYQIVNDINQKIYVGKTEFSIEKRFKEHCKDAFKNRNEKRPLYAAMQKYGIEHFHIELLEETDNPEEREIYWIEKLDTYFSGYNATLGGDGKKLLDYNKIIEKLKEFPYPCQVAEEFNCSPSMIRLIAKANGILVKNLSQEKMKKEKSKEVFQYSKNGDYLTNFSSVSEAAKWCYENKKCSTLNSGVRSHIAEVANGKRKSAYGYIWRYTQ